MTTRQCVISKEATMMVDWTMLSTFLAALVDWAAAVVVVLAVGQPTKDPRGTDDR
ncbi:MAG: hypothetical protein P4M07_16920 [Xanthobacteraceae bacterium]|nr:hypothetical protein [Xanthobacteraceae bacterium]